MKKLIIILVFTTLFACNKSDETEVHDGVYIYAGLEFSIYNLQNEDLLNSENPNYLDNIKLFYDIDGEKKEVYNQGFDNPKGFRIYKHENEYRISVSLNHSETSDKPISYIQWNDKSTDTIEVIYGRSKSGVAQNKIWLNGKQIWELGNGEIEPYFVLTK